jgi:hypothetical protein
MILWVKEIIAVIAVVTALDIFGHWVGRFANCPHRSQVRRPAVGLLRHNGPLPGSQPSRLRPLGLAISVPINCCKNIRI